MKQLLRARYLRHAFGSLSIVGAGIAGFGCATDQESDVDVEPIASTIELPLSIGGSCGGERCDSVVRGALSFLDRDLHGLASNGRACADCHMPTDDFQLSPATAEARYQRLQQRRQWNPRADDPLFRPIDADDFRTNGQSASDYSNLRQNGLIRITFPLPANFKLVDPVTGAPTAETSVDVWRSVPSVNNVALTGPDASNPWPRGPNPAGGYQLDARFGTLQEQATAALFTHAQVTSAPSTRLLDDLTAFQRILFSSSGVRNLSDAIRAGTTPLPDADPPLSALEQQGKAVFTRACAQCHGGPGQSTPKASPPPPIPHYHDIATACPRPVDAAPVARWHFDPCPPRLARNARVYEITLPNGTTLRRPSSDPGRALLTGFAGGVPPVQDDWNKLDNTGLHGIRNTAPYFHNNSADSLDAVLDHYDALFKFAAATAPPGLIPPILTTNGTTIDRPFTTAERPALLAYMQKL